MYILYSVDQYAGIIVHLLRRLPSLFRTVNETPCIL